MPGSGKYICTHCGECFSRLERLERHIFSLHTGEKPYECTECGVRFGRKDHLTRHKFIHTGEKKWKCTFEGCDKAYYEQSHWKQHQQSHLLGSSSRKRKRAAETDGCNETRVDTSQRADTATQNELAAVLNDADGMQEHPRKRMRCDSTLSMASAMGAGATAISASVSAGPHESSTRRLSISSGGGAIKLPPSRFAAVVASADPFEVLPELVTEAFAMQDSSDGAAAINDTPIVRMQPLSMFDVEAIAPDIADVLKHRCFYPNCTKEYKQKRDLRAHIRYDHDKDTLKCPHCAKEFKRPKYWEKHTSSCVPCASPVAAPKPPPLAKASSLSEFITVALGVHPWDTIHDINAARTLPLSPLSSPLCSSPLVTDDDVLFGLEPGIDDQDDEGSDDKDAALVENADV